MKIWVDADACPKVIKEIIFRAANRKQIETTLVANHFIPVPNSHFIKSVQVPAGFDVADNEIVKQVEKDDLVITQDIPLASEVIEKQAIALSPRGELFTRENIKQRLNMRDFYDTLRSSGIQTGGPAALNQQDRMAFGNQLDKLLARVK